MSNKHRAVTIHPQVRLVACRRAEENKKGKEGRKTPKTVANWLFTQTTHVVGSKSNFALWWPAVCSYTCQVWSKSVKGLRCCGGRNGPYPLLWPVVQLVLPYKPWSIYGLAFIHLPARVDCYKYSFFPGTSPCGLRGCKNRPAPFPDRMS